jgi:hypothetical protein
LKWQALQEEKADKRWQKEHGLQRFSLLVVGILGTVILAASQIIAALIQTGYFNKPTAPSPTPTIKEMPHAIDD